MFVIKNLTKEVLPIGNDVTISPGEQIGNISVLSPEMNALWDAKKLQVKDSDETLAEREADVDAINSFKP